MLLRHLGSLPAWRCRGAAGSARQAGPTADHPALRDGASQLVAAPSPPCALTSILPSLQAPTYITGTTYGDAFLVRCERLARGWCRPARPRVPERCAPGQPQRLCTPAKAAACPATALATQAAGAVLALIDNVVAASQQRRAGGGSGSSGSSGAPAGFAIIRPPGHHSMPGSPMGFCIMANAAIAARYAQRRHGLERVLIFDFDVHHGNGTQAAFEADPSVLFVSTHMNSERLGCSSGVLLLQQRSSVCGNVCCGSCLQRHRPATCMEAAPKLSCHLLHVQAATLTAAA